MCGVLVKFCLLVQPWWEFSLAEHVPFVRSWWVLALQADKHWQFYEHLYKGALCPEVLYRSVPEPLPLEVLHCGPAGPDHSACLCCHSTAVSSLLCDLCCCTWDIDLSLSSNASVYAPGRSVFGCGIFAYAHQLLCRCCRPPYLDWKWELECCSTSDLYSTLKTCSSFHHATDPHEE